MGGAELATVTKVNWPTVTVRIERLGRPETGSIHVLESDRTTLPAGTGPHAHGLRPLEPGDRVLVVAYGAIADQWIVVGKVLT